MEGFRGKKFLDKKIKQIEQNNKGNMPATIEELKLLRKHIKERQTKIDNLIEEAKQKFNTETDQLFKGVNK